MKKQYIILMILASLNFLFWGGFRLRCDYVENNTQPIKCEILKIHCMKGMRDNNRCELRYNNKIYTSINLVNGCEKYSTGTNTTDFYYDSVFDRVFCKSLITNVIVVVFATFFVLSFIPLIDYLRKKRNFKEK
ncbi:hypothetical protein M2451_003480 [Dysgonomonas sp. PFB1-18]|uniref:hypothetical protein n=1 Tax=unclassified Dysgonomonas TaxID=2630389 RepID=UPI002473A368|nr:MULTISPECIES: hypothetical protein [unclassified Dysgonomonas]MDH6310601.1 hypothetical protein [Dysgonomonas sp. PF1-14]MDH6340452.1 hypothetical protein [Dysgonomonas sp. PF1-16]MDH6382140.1 hypothetical protein [Dysgonomonas sp. PFB1-18]MDH6399484.1 hypothetical protein [Dysgonomonas sp. PF1-23]